MATIGSTAKKTSKQIADEYIKKAQDYVNPEYNNQVTDINNQYFSNRNTLNNQYSKLAGVYSDRLKANEQSYGRQRGQTETSMRGRGLSNSTYAQDYQNMITDEQNEDKLVIDRDLAENQAEINSKLAENDIWKSSNLSTLNKNRSNAVRAYADTLRARDAEQALAEQKYNNDYYFKAAELALKQQEQNKGKVYSDALGRSVSESDAAAYNSIMEELQNSPAHAWRYDDRYTERQVPKYDTVGNIIGYTSERVYMNPNYNPKTDLLNEIDDIELKNILRQAAYSAQANLKENKEIADILKNAKNQVSYEQSVTRPWGPPNNSDSSSILSNWKSGTKSPKLTPKGPVQPYPYPSAMK
jgi:hypothetical protein